MTTDDSRPPVRRPRRSNDPISIVRAIRTAKAIYWTSAKLRKLLPGVYSTARQEHFARAVKALRSWPELTRDENFAAASRVQPRRLMYGKWSWPKSMVTGMREYAEDAPAEDVDTDKLRQTLGSMDRRTKERFMDLLADELPETPGKKNWLLRKVRQLHSKLVLAVDGDPDGDLATRRPPE